LTEAGAPIETIALIGGGARSRFWGRIIATVIDRPLLLPQLAMLGPALGAARLARQAVGGALIGEIDRGATVTLEPDAASRAGLQQRRAIYRRHYAPGAGS
jgi:xylulokinase